MLWPIYSMLERAHDDKWSEVVRQELAHLNLLSPIYLKHLHTTISRKSEFVEQLCHQMKVSHLRTIVGPFTIHDIDACIHWLDQGCQYVVVDIATTELSDESYVEQLSRAISELPLHRVFFCFSVASVASCAILSRVIQNLNAPLAGLVINLEPEFLPKIAETLEFHSFLNSEVSPLQQRVETLGGQIFLEIQTSVDSNLVTEIINHHVPRVHFFQETKDTSAAFISGLRTDRKDGLFTTVVTDCSGVALGLVYSSQESIALAIEHHQGIYYSRSRAETWKKGATSGNLQRLVRVDVDCDADALRFQVEQLGEGPNSSGAFCHLNTRTCWGHDAGFAALERTLRERKAQAPPGSYTQRLFEDQKLLTNKLLEEAQELAEAQEFDDIAAEAADLIYFALVRATAAGVSIHDIESHLNYRALKVKRRPGNSKAFRIEAAAKLLQEISEEKQKTTHSA